MSCQGILWNNSDIPALDANHVPENLTLNGKKDRAAGLV